jgi:hypothetical protein
MKPRILKRLPKEVTSVLRNPGLFRPVNVVGEDAELVVLRYHETRKQRIWWNVQTGQPINTDQILPLPYSPIGDGTYWSLWVPAGVDIYSPTPKTFGPVSILEGEEGEAEDAKRYEAISGLLSNDDQGEAQTPNDATIVQPTPESDDDEGEFWEQVTPIYNGFAPAELLYRSDKFKDRYYFRRPEGSPPVGYLSMTSFVKKALPTSPYLLKWYQTHGAQADEMRDERSEYGTILHIVCVRTVINGGGSFREIRETFREAAKATEGANVEQWEEDGVRDVLAFLTFVVETEVEILAAEYPVYSDKYGLAGCLDFVVRIKFGRVKVNAIVDLKSGRKGFYESHEAQLHGYKTVWNEDPYRREVFPVTHVFNWRPSAWRDIPKYELKNQTESIFAETIEHRMELARLEGWVDPPKFRQVIDGEFTLENFDWKNHITNLPIFGE